MRKLCLDCLKITRSKSSLIFDNIYIGILDVLVGISVLYGRDSSFLALIFGTTLIVFGIIIIVNYYRGGNTCPSCNNESLIPLDTSEAIELIKENDISAPKEVAKKNVNKLPWQSS